jgi:hypothetical protein
MTLLLGVAQRNQQASVLEGLAGVRLCFYAGSVPDTSAETPGTLLAEAALPPDWLLAPVDGVITKHPAPWLAAVVQTGTPTHFRIENLDGSCRLQGLVGLEPADDTVQLSTLEFRLGMTIEVTAFSYTPGAT